MPLFVVSCTDREGTVEKRLAIRPQHLARLEHLNAEGRLIVAGAMPKDPANPKAGFTAVPLLSILTVVKHWIHGYRMSHF